MSLAKDLIRDKEMVFLQGQGSLMGMLFPLVIFVVIFYFFIIRPQKKRQKAHDQLISSLNRGDQIVTAGGFWGTVKEVKEDSVIIEIAEGVKARVLKSSIATKHDRAAETASEQSSAEPVKDTGSKEDE
jgi:preprotein translocase subunit YajC